jgi:hypothetical protein
MGLLTGSLAFAEPVVEYYNPLLDHYFMTPLANEIDALDNGRIRGWGRTGFIFEGFASPTETNAVAANPVCRFYIPPQHGDSHFFSASRTECDDVLAKIPTDPNYSGYIEETAAEFHIALPDIMTGACPAGTVPVYRLWNQRADSNHRYTTDLATRDALLARGYRAEGYGALGVAMCTTSSGIGDSRVRVTDASPFAPGCDGASNVGSVLYSGAEVEPYVAVDPRNPSHLVGVWQQDRWSDGGSRGLSTGYSFDGGRTWNVTHAIFSRCTGGNAGNGADYARASDPWVTLGPDGIAYQIAIAFNGNSFAPGSSSAVLASRSTDGGATWEPPIALIRDGSTPFDDKESITADPLTPGYAYASWDRIEQNGHGPSFFARTTDGGVSWEAARLIYNPGGRNQTLNNQVIVPASGGSAGTLYNFFTEFIAAAPNIVTTRLAFVRSSDRGQTWSGVNVASDMLGVGTHDPQTLRDLRDGVNIASIASGPNGALVAVWQDARFSGGARDGVAFSRSLDGGNTWSTPAQINAVPAVQAFLPAVTVRADGTIGVLYYDMRSNTDDPLTLLVDTWLATSTDGVNWSERHMAGPFDFRTAPMAEGGFFIGDYQGLASAPGEFVGFFVQPNPQPATRTDVFATMTRSTAPLSKAAREYRVTETVVPPTPLLLEKSQRAAERTLARRLIGASSATSLP